MKIKKLLLISFIFILILLSSCTKNENKKKLYPTYTFKRNADMSKINGLPWIDFSRPGAIKMVERPELKNDFYGYVNYDELSNMTIDDEFSKGGIFESTNTTYSNIEYLFNNTNTNSNYGKAISRIYNLYSNSNKDLEKSYINAKIDEIMSINTKEGIYDYIFSQKGMGNPSSPFHFKDVDGELIIYANNINYDYIYLLTMVAMYNGNNRKAVDLSKNCLMKYGISEDKAYTISKQGIEADYRNFINYALPTYEEYALHVSFNKSWSYSEALYNYFISLGYNDDTSVKYYTGIKDFLRFVVQEKDLEIIKSVLAYRLGFSYKICLSISDYSDIVLSLISALSNIPTSLYDDKTLMYELFMTNFTDLLDRAYIDEFITNENMRNALEELTNKIINEYKETIDSQSWLLFQSRWNLKSKLDNLGVDILYPDYLNSVPNFNDNSSDLFAKYLESYTLWSSTVNKDVEQKKWMTSITYPNATYLYETNSITIYAGLLSNPDLYNENMTTEEIFGGLGFVIAHEISHAFDSNGINYDENGKNKDILDYDSKSVYNDKVAMIEKSYSKLKYTSSRSVSGKTVIYEAVADVCGLQLMLELAKEENSFNYESFFESYAKSFSCLYNEKCYESNYLYTDTHPLPMMRVNYVLNDFQEFYDTFDIKSGNLMYKDPNDRITIWE